MSPLAEGRAATSMDQDDLLSTLRNLEPEEEPSLEVLVLESLAITNNHLEDLKLKQSITNEYLKEIFDELKNRSGSDHAAQARPIRNTPPPFRRRSWT